MSLPTALRAARSYVAAESSRQASFGTLPEVLPDFTPFSGITFRDGLAHLLIDPRHQPRTFDPAIAFALKLFEEFGGNLLINCREKRGVYARAYVRADIGSTHIYVNRAIMDAPPGFVVRETGANFRSHLPEHLVVREAPLRDGPNKHISGRADFIEAILTAYDKSDAPTLALISRQDLEDLLVNLFVLADWRAFERHRERGSVSELIRHSVLWRLI